MISDYSMVSGDYLEVFDIDRDVDFFAVPILDDPNSENPNDVTDASAAAEGECDKSTDQSSKFGKRLRIRIPKLEIPWPGKSESTNQSSEFKTAEDPNP